jgi:hypothetical protein
MNYDPSNWYWIVGADAAQVFASASASYVATTDKTYVTWLAEGNEPTRIASEQELWDVLSQAFPAGIPAANTDAQDRLKGMKINAMDQIAMRVAFNHENRIRALEGKQAATAAQFVTALKALL